MRKILKIRIARPRTWPLLILKWIRGLDHLTIRKPMFILLVFKLIYTLYGVFVFGKISSISDADTYLNASINLSRAALTNNTLLMGTITSLLKHILFLDIFVHFVYCILSFYCLKLVIDELKLTKKQEYFVVLMLIMPTFGMWTSIIVKESLSCSTSCIVLIWILNIINNKKLRFSIFLNVFCLYLTLILRPVVGLSLICLISTLYLYKLPILNKYLRFIIISAGLVLFTVGAVSFTLKYIKNEFIPMAELYFDPRYAPGKSSRPLGFWKSAADFYLKAPEGIYIANRGPSLIESIENPFYIPYFFEGMFFIFVCIYLLITDFYYQVKRAVINPNLLYVVLFGIALTLLLNYPFGLFNAGSAIRYRSSYYHIIIVLLMYFYTTGKKLAR